MPKLATPVQYEPALEGLNDIRPLQLADESKVVIPYPVLCKNPPSKGRPAVGMFARCSQQGALLKNVSYKAVLPEYKYRNVTVYDMHTHFTFSSKVSYVIAIWKWLGGSPVLYWSDPTYLYNLKTLSNLKYTFLPFIGTDIYFGGRGLGEWNVDLFVYSFYK